MAHSHANDDNYFLDQIFAISFCGALAACSLSLYYTDGLFFVAKRFRILVMLGGFALSAVVLVRAVAVWRQAGKARADSHDHDHHDHDHAHHDHDHAHHDHAHHDHDHDHEHGWAPWRYVLLLLPIALYFLRMPREIVDDNTGSEMVSLQQLVLRESADKEPSKLNLSSDVTVLIDGVKKSLGDLKPIHRLLAKIENQAGQKTVVEIRARSDDKPFAVSFAEQMVGKFERVETNLVKKRGVIHNPLDFVALENAAQSPDGRAQLEGFTATLEGQFRTTDDPNQFRLTRRKMVCCATDSIPLKAIIMIDPNWGTKRGQKPLDWRARVDQWVKVTGRIQFFKRANRDEYLSAFIIYPDEKNPPDKLVEIINVPRSQWFLE